MPAGVILAGGEGRRFGSDKVIAKIADTTLLDRVIEVHRLAGCSPIIVAVRGDASRVPSDCIVALDAAGAAGPRAGLKAGLDAAATAGAEWAWLSPVDVPLLDPMLLSVLAGAREAMDEAVMPVSDEGDEPLLGLVEVAAMLRALAASSDGRSSAASLYGLLMFRRLVVADLEDSSIDESCFLNVNRPGDLMRASDLLTDRR